jgi:hypothetical protein
MRLDWAKLVRGSRRQRPTGVERYGLLHDPRNEEIEVQAPHLARPQDAPKCRTHFRPHRIPSYLMRRLFGDMVRRIAVLPVPTGWTVAGKQPGRRKGVDG